jgi:uncharacterized protein YdeI (YjbR/CyaY-like superfamily)
MGTQDPRIDAYIAKSKDFARPILVHLREVVHAACPDVEETLKWSMPHFMYHGMLCGMAAFKEHCTFGFWKGALVVGDAQRNSKREGTKESGMGQFGRITSIKDLPNKKVLAAYIKKAMKLNEEGTKVPKQPAKKKAPLPVPEDLAAALKKNKAAAKAFADFSPSHQREYIEWITEAKRAETRAKRLATALEWLAEGKPRNWKYMNS